MFTRATNNARYTRDAPPTLYSKSISNQISYRVICELLDYQQKMFISSIKHYCSRMFRNLRNSGIYQKQVNFVYILLMVGIFAFAYWFIISKSCESSSSDLKSLPVPVKVKDKLALQKQLQKWESAYQLHDPEISTPMNATVNRTNTFWDRYPPAFPCPYTVQRIGSIADGGKNICGFSKIMKFPKCVVYSCGISNEVTFDRMILEQTNCSVHMIDSDDIQSNPAALLSEFGSERVTFSKLILGSGGPSLKALMEKNGDSYIDILKVDIENGEYTFLSGAVQEFPEGLPIGQLQVEIHTTNNKASDPMGFRDWFYSLEKAGLRTFYTEPNPVHPVTLWEYAFLSIKFGMFKIET